MTNVGIAERVAVDADTVSKWRKRFAIEGLAGLNDRHRSGRPRVFAAEVVAGVKAMACEPALAENLVRAGHAACWYSWRMPPRRSRLRMSRWAILSGSAIGAANGRSGRAFAMPWWGRWEL